MTWTDDSLQPRTEPLVAAPPAKNSVRCATGNGEDIAVRVREPGDEVATRGMPHAQFILIKAVESMERHAGIAQLTDRGRDVIR